MTNEITEEMKNSIYTKELIRILYREGKDISAITERTNELLAKREEGLFITEETARKFIAQIEKDALKNEHAIDADVDKMLRSLGQSLSKNQEKAEEKEKSLFNKNSPQNHLRFCQVLVDKETERKGVSYHG